jgi:hypothetical protein
MAFDRLLHFRPRVEILEERDLPNNLFNPLASSLMDVFEPAPRPHAFLSSLGLSSPASDGRPAAASAAAAVQGTGADATASSAGLSVADHGDGQDDSAALVAHGLARNANVNPGVLPADSHPFGATYNEWSARWWQYALSIPTSQSPFTDTTGADFSVGQSGHVWFLSGTFCLNMNGMPCTFSNPAAVTRDVTMPTGKALFFPILNSEADNLDFTTGRQDLGFTPDQLRSQITPFMDDVVTHGFMTTSVDGVVLQNLASYRFASPVFSYTLPDNNIAGVPAQTVTPAVADGYYLMLAPLSAGQHQIHFTGGSPLLNFSLDVTYNITVTPGGSN